MIKIVYAGAGWCGPCKMLKPIVLKFFEDFDNQFEYEVVDIEQDESFVSKFSIQSVPTIIFLRGDKEVARLIGMQSRKKLEQTLDEVMI